jgi:phosphoglycerate dehydrogenase-like enzyme
MVESSGGSPTVVAAGQLKVAVVQDYAGIARESADWSKIEELAELDFLSSALVDENAAAKALAEYDVICSMRERLPLTESLLDRLPNLRLFVATSESNRMIDYAAADARGVEVAGTPNGGFSSSATAELTWGLIIAAMRGIVWEDRAVRAGTWQLGVHSSLYGKTVGVVGLGRVGRYIARYAREFGANVLAYTPGMTDVRAVEAKAEAVSLDDLLRRSDVVSVHLVLSDSTRHIIDERALSLMKPTAVLVNTSRGPLVDESALAQALGERRIAAAALDAFAAEPLPIGHPFLQLDNIILSPHAGGFTSETYRVWYEGTVDAVLAFLEGREIPVRQVRDV